MKVFIILALCFFNSLHPIVMNCTPPRYQPPEKRNSQAQANGNERQSYVSNQRASVNQPVNGLSYRSRNTPIVYTQQNSSPVQENYGQTSYFQPKSSEVYAPMAALPSRPASYQYSSPYSESSNVDNRPTDFYQPKSEAITSSPYSAGSSIYQLRSGEAYASMAMPSLQTSYQNAAAHYSDQMSYAQPESAESYGQITAMPSLQMSYQNAAAHYSDQMSYAQPESAESYGQITAMPILQTSYAAQSETAQPSSEDTQTDGQAERSKETADYTAANADSGENTQKDVVYYSYPNKYKTRLLNCCRLLQNFWNCSNPTLELYAANAFGKTIGVDHSYSTAGIWLTSENDEGLSYFNLGYNHIWNGDNGVNVGAGVRFGSPEKGCGASLYYDWRGQHSRCFNQISPGLEAWYHCWETRVNVYLPLNSRQSFHKFNASFPGGYKISSRDTLFSCQLATLLIGKRFNICDCYLPNLTFLPLIGPYWVSHSHKKNRYGCLLELDVSLYNIFSLKGILSSDPIFKTRFEAILSISVPLSCSWVDTLCDCFNRFYARPNRFNLISLKKVNFCNRNW